MQVFVGKQPDQVTLQIRAEGQGTIGDVTIDVRPGETFLGRPFEEWRDGPPVVEVDQA